MQTDRISCDACDATLMLIENGQLFVSQKATFEPAKDSVTCACGRTMPVVIERTLNIFGNEAQKQRE